MGALQFISGWQPSVTTTSPCLMGGTGSQGHISGHRNARGRTYHQSSESICEKEERE